MGARYDRIDREHDARKREIEDLEQAVVWIEQHQTGVRYAHPGSIALLKVIARKKNAFELFKSIHGID